MQGRDGVDSAEFSPGWNDIVAFLTITLDLHPSVLVAILNHDDKPGPTFGQVVGRHTLSSFMPLT